ncbi:hypothetical protein ACFY19_20630 [Streptosporangium saharense]|uniref:hypothetical protein n=1 Tax=Streptosporangium saharense TaxID=1706840 RepID=UPI0036A13390
MNIPIEITTPGVGRQVITQYDPEGRRQMIYWGTEQQARAYALLCGMTADDPRRVAVTAALHLGGPGPGAVEVRDYVRTHSATTKHVANPDDPTRTLCGHAVSTRCAGILPHMRPYYYGLPTCVKCDGAANRRGLAEGAEIYRQYAPRIIRHVERAGFSCIVNADTPETTLCGRAISLRLNDAPFDGTPAAALTPCASCRDFAALNGYRPATPDDESDLPPHTRERLATIAKAARHLRTTAHSTLCEQLATTTLHACWHTDPGGLATVLEAAGPVSDLGGLSWGARQILHAAGIPG